MIAIVFVINIIITSTITIIFMKGGFVTWPGGAPPPDPPRGFRDTPRGVDAPKWS